MTAFFSLTFIEHSHKPAQIRQAHFISFPRRCMGTSLKADDAMLPKLSGT
jgi:hypothetical protein